MAVVVKREGHRERFDERKVYGSIYAACSSAFYPEKKCERVAAEVTEKVKKFLKKKKAVKSSEIHKKVERELRKKDKELAFFYDRHLPNLKKL